VKTISIISDCYNDEGNLQEFYERITSVLKKFPHYAYEIIIADLAQLLVSLYPEKKLSFLRQAFHSEFVSKALDAHPDITKISALGWAPKVDLATSFKRTIDSFSNLPTKV